MFNENDTNNSGKPIWWDGKQIRYDSVPYKNKPAIKDKEIRLKYRTEKKSEKKRSIKKEYLNK